MPAFRSKYKLCLSFPLLLCHQHSLPFLLLRFVFHYSVHLSISLNLPISATCHLTFLIISRHLSSLESDNTSFHPSLVHPPLPPLHPLCLTLFSLTSFLRLPPFISTTSWLRSSTPHLPSFYLPFLAEQYTGYHSCIHHSTHYSQSRGNTHMHVQAGMRTQIYLSMHSKMCQKHG